MSEAQEETFNQDDWSAALVMTPETYDAWFARVTRAVMFLLGTAILGYSAFSNQPDRPWLYAVSLTLMIPPAAGTVERALRKATADAPALTPGEPPKEKP